MRCTTTPFTNYLRRNWLKLNKNSKVGHIRHYKYKSTVEKGTQQIQIKFTYNITLQKNSLCAIPIQQMAAIYNSDKLSHCFVDWSRSNIQQNYAGLATKIHA